MHFLRGVFLGCFMVLCAIGVLNAQDSKGITFPDSNYYFLGLLASTNSNVVFIYVANYEEMAEIYRAYMDDEEGVENKAGNVYILAYNVQNEKLLLKEEHFDYCFEDLKENNGTISLSYPEYRTERSYMLSGDTVFKEWSYGVHTETGKVIWGNESSRFWRKGGSIYEELPSGQVQTKNFDLKISGDKRSVVAEKHDFVFEYVPDRVYDYTKVAKSFGLSQKTNLLSSEPLVKEFFSYEIGSGFYDFHPLSKSVFFHLSMGWKLQNLRFRGKTALGSDVLIKKHRARTVTFFEGVGFTKAFGKKDKYYVQVELQGGFNVYSRYSYWDEFDEKHKRKRSVLNRWVCGSKVVFGRSSWSFFAEYRISPLFKKQIEKPSVAPLSIGFEGQTWHFGRGGPSDKNFYRLD